MPISLKKVSEDKQIMPCNILHNYKILLVGGGGVGKTTFLKRYISNVFDKKYIASFGVKETKVILNTNKGGVTLNIFDFAGQEKFSGDYSSKYIGAHACIGFIDSSYYSITELLTYLREIINATGIIPLTITHTKCDLEINELNINVIQVSAKTGDRINEPFAAIIKMLMGSDTIIYN